ncbi:PREDICTED: uncharacterized protein LOC109128520 [Camelina sativa]|uniref:Uncharacterized protein LOC109128520 n=1 Tax=Camelina sativa TaxID=90675 RepID=A0ABM1QVD9_CAMSA|nr:PREDICTED: uncharacterized protein LOC109128520 [Camelina sativa]
MDLVHDRSTVLSSLNVPTWNFQGSPLDKTNTPDVAILPAATNEIQMEPYTQKCQAEEDTLSSETATPSSTHPYSKDLPLPENLYEVRLNSSYVYDVLNSEPGTSGTTNSYPTYRKHPLKPARIKKGSFEGRGSNQVKEL